MDTPDLDALNTLEAANDFRRSLLAATTQQTKTQQIGAAFTAVLDLVRTFDDPKLSASMKLFQNAAEAVGAHAVLELLKPALCKVDEGACRHHHAQAYSDADRNLNLLHAMGRSLEGACEMVKALNPPIYQVRGVALEHLRAALGNLAMGLKCPLCELRPSDPGLKGKRGRPPNSVEEMSVHLLAAAGVEFLMKHTKVKGTAYLAVAQELQKRKFVRPTKRGCEPIKKETVRGWHDKFTSDPELAQLVRMRFANIEALGTPLSLKEARVQFGRVCQWAVENVPNLPRAHRSR